MNAPPAPKLSRRTSFSVVWIVPLVALLVAAWMVLREWKSHGPEVTIEFKDGSGIEAGKTELEFNGVSVGRVRRVTLKDDLSGVTVLLRLDKSAASLAKKGSAFWVVHPEIGFGGVRGLDTLVSGVRLNVQPGSGPEERHFRGLDKAPPIENAQDGKAFLLRTDRLGTLLPHAAVLYRDVKVGEVETSRLTEDATAVLIRIRVQLPYADLVRTNSQFWNAGGVPIKISLFGAEVRSTSVESLLTGAIAFASPDELGPIAEEGAVFQLSTEVNKDWLKWHPKIPVHPPNEAPDTRRPENVVPNVLKASASSAAPRE